MGCYVFDFPSVISKSNLKRENEKDLSISS